MQNYDLLNIINNIDAVNGIINAIKDNFEKTIKSYEPNHHGDANAYFLTGHCNVLIEILHNIFSGNLEVYVLSTKDCITYNHVIAKIGENFYDINGYISPSTPNLDKYEPRTYEEFAYYEDLGLIGNMDPLSKKIIPDLTIYGVQVLYDVTSNKLAKKDN